MGKEAIKILLVDNDPIFRLGLVTALKPLNDIKIIAHLPLEGLAKELVRMNELPDLIVIDPFFSVQTPAKDLVKQAYQILQKKYTDIPIFLLTKPLSQKQLKQYKLLGFKGYCSKGTGLNVLVDIFRQIARGEEYWQTNVSNNKSSLLAKIRQNKWLYHWQNSGINQIDYRLRQIQQELKEDDFSFLDWLVLQGRKRELLAARWLVSKMAESPGNQAYLPAPLTNPSSSIKEEKQREIKQLITQQQFKVTIFINTAQKIPLGTKNLTDITLEIDILTPEKKEKLIYLVLIKLNQLILESAGSSLSPKNLPARLENIVRDLWQLTIIELLSPEYIPGINIEQNYLRDALVADSENLREYISLRIPLLADLLKYLFFQLPLKIEDKEYDYDSLPANQRAEKLLHNFLIALANAVVQFVLNNFTNLEIIKYNLYQSRYRTYREITRFRNQLSWQYRQQNLFNQPINIFESKYDIFIFTELGIKLHSIYSPRIEELISLRGIKWIITILLETLDAISPHFKNLIAFIGRGLVFVLTQVIGRSIGLIGRGIIQGIGNTLQETKEKQNPRNNKN